MTPIQREWAAALPRRMLVPYYLMASFLYYHCDQSAMTDDAYDLVCRRLDREWPIIEHRHKKIVKRNSLTATTGYNLRRRDYPIMVQVAAHSLYASVEAGTILGEMRTIKGFSLSSAPAARPRVITQRPSAPKPVTRVLPRRILPR